MATDTLRKTATTNTQDGSVCKIEAGCDTMWSLAQQFAYDRLSRREQGYTFRPVRALMADYAQRARVISATYSRFYLELEDYGDPKKKGRYYWMALGAFASKTVACTLDLIRVDAGKLMPKLGENWDFGYVRDGLGKGNFWLFQDIAPTHWYHSYSAATFEDCLSARGRDGCHKQVLDNLKRFPWAETALPTLNYLKLSSYIIESFKTVKAIENSSKGTQREKLQLDHLLKVAEHEQQIVLQPLMYEDDKFAKWVQRQRGWMSWFSPDLELIFTHECKTSDKIMKSSAPEETVLEDYNSRMTWIRSAANDFHELMKRKKPFMEKELATMAAWHVSN